MPGLGATAGELRYLLRTAPEVGWNPFPPDVSFDDVCRAHGEHLNARRFLSSEAYLTAERGTAGSWDEDIETMLRAQMMAAQDGAIVPRIEAATADAVAAC
jgi:hypothetical protein